jgi:hypothetical protein
MIDEIEDDLYEEITDETTNTNKTNITFEPLNIPDESKLNIHSSEPVRKPREMPAKYAQNQKKYEAAMEKKKQPIAKEKQNNKKQPVTTNINNSTDNMRRVLVNGRYKYIPINKATESTQESDTKIVPITIETEEKELLVKSLSPVANQQLKSTNKKDTSHGIPPKYAREMEKYTRKDTTKNVRNLSELQRINDKNSFEDMGISADINKLTVQERRRLHAIQKQKDNEKKIKENSQKRVTDIDKIYNNEKMTPFAKMVAVHNLSPSSRHDSVRKTILNGTV